MVVTPREPCCACFLSGALIERPKPLVTYPVEVRGDEVHVACPRRG